MKIPEGTLGALLREQRWTRGLEQRQAAVLIGTTLATYRNWETNFAAPTLKYVPGVIAFLGYDWRPQGASLGDRIRQTRTAVGLSIKQVAVVLDTDPSTISRWEAGLGVPSKRSADKLKKWLVHPDRSDPVSS